MRLWAAHLKHVRELTVDDTRERDVRDSFGKTQIGDAKTLDAYLTEKEIATLEDAIDRANSAAFAARAARIQAASLTPCRDCSDPWLSTGLCDTHRELERSQAR